MIPLPEQFKLELWEELKQRNCSNPATALRLVMLERKAFEAAFDAVLLKLQSHSKGIGLDE